MGHFIDDTKGLIPKFAAVIEGKVDGLGSIIDANARPEKYFVDRSETECGGLYFFI